MQSIPLLFRHSSILAICAAVFSGNALRAVAETSSGSTVELMIVYDPASSTEPATDTPVRVLEAHPIRLSVGTAAGGKSDEIRGRLALRVLEDGTVGRVRFETARPSKPIVAEIEQGLARWRFEPLERFGKRAEAWVHVVYSSSPAPVSGADAPPRSLFAVLAGYPIELWRPWAQTGAAAPVVSLPGDSAPKPPQRASAGVPGVGGQARRAAVGDNPSVSMAPGRNVLGKPGAGPSPESHAAWFSGHVTLRVDIDATGSVTAAEVVRSTASCFEPLAAATLLRWRFAPAIVAGEPAATRMIVPISTPGTIENPPPLFFKPDPSSATPWDEPPRMRHLDLPIYPQDLFAAGVTGRASARVTLDATGAATQVELLDATHPAFGHALLASIDRCQHEPARRGGRRVATTILRTAVFETDLWNRKPVAQETPALLLAAHDIQDLVAEDQLDIPLKRILGTPPAFTQESGGDAVEATVEFIVSYNGEVLAPQIVNSTNPAAGYAAVQAVASWRYAPPNFRGGSADVLARATFAGGMVPRR